MKGIVAGELPSSALENVNVVGLVWVTKEYGILETEYNGAPLAVPVSVEVPIVQKLDGAALAVTVGGVLFTVMANVDVPQTVV